MTRTEILLRKSPLYPALRLEGYFSAKKRKLLIKIAEYLLFSIPFIINLSIIFTNYNSAGPSETTDFLIRKLLGLVFISLGLYILMEMFEAYFISIYYFEYIA